MRLNKKWEEEDPIKKKKKKGIAGATIGNGSLFTYRGLMTQVVCRPPLESRP